MGLVLITAPETEPLDLAEAKQHLRVTTTDEDVYIQQLIVAARRWAETWTRRVFITQTWDWHLDSGFEQDIYKIPYSPLQSITSVKYLDVNGTEQTLSASVYVTDIKSQPGRIALGYNQSWPDIYDQINNMTVRFVAGYGTPEDVPEDITHALKIIVAHLYEHREPVIVGAAISNVPLSAESLLWPHRVDLP